MDSKPDDFLPNFSVSLRSNKLKLFISYAFSMWADIMWQFTVALALVEIGCNLRLPAISGFVNGTAILLFASTIGHWIDKTQRLRAAATCLIVNNISVAIAALFLIATLYWHETVHATTKYILVAFCIVFTALTMLCGTGTNIALAKDWIVVLAGDDQSELATANSAFVGISLTCMIVSPLIAGQIMASISALAGCIFIAVWHVASFPVEYFLLKSIYNSVPDLSKKKIMTEKNAEGDAIPVPTSSAWLSGLKAWKIYKDQKVFPAGFALATLYMTVLGLDGITTGFAYEQGLRPNYLALIGGLGAIIGIFGSICFPKMRTLFGLPKTGIVAFICQLVCASVTIVSIFLPGSPFNPGHYFAGRNESEIVSGNSTDDCVDIFGKASSYWSIGVFLGGLIFARFGLWISDLSITQQMQEAVLEHQRGIVFGVQHSLNQLMDMLKSVLVIFLPSTETFGLLIIASVTFYLLGFASYLYYYSRVRKSVRDGQDGEKPEAEVFQL